MRVDTRDDLKLNILARVRCHEQGSHGERRSRALLEPKHNSAERILRCAADLFATSGFERTSIRDICNAAAISRPVLYHFYGSKQGLFRAVIRRACRHFNVRLATALTGDYEFRDRCRHLVQLLFDDAVNNPQLWRLMLASIWSPGASANRDLADMRTQFSRKLGAEAMKAVVRGELRDVSDAISVQILFGTVAFVVASFLGTGEPDLRSTSADCVVSAIFDGLAPQ